MINLFILTDEVRMLHTHTHTAELQGSRLWLCGAINTHSVIVYSFKLNSPSTVNTSNTYL